MVVVVRGVIFQDSRQVPPPMMSIRPVTSARAVRTRRWACAFARGRRGGIFTTSIPAPAGTASNVPVHCPARSQIMNWNRAACPPTSIRRFGACCPVRAPSG